MNNRIGSVIVSPVTILALLLTLCLQSSPVFAQTDDPRPPEQPVKLIFIHHSTGENWLTDGYGDLGKSLGEANYFVSDTNYGWGPDAIGDRTDIPNWEEWFSSPNTPIYMEALFSESGQNAGYTRTLTDPGGENTIILFKSCFPNSDLYGNPDDPPGTYAEMTVSGAKYVYNTILPYFASRPDKLFIVITAPPLSDRTNASNARAFNQWLVNDWLAENQYTQNNVAVFDFYNVLTGKDAHHRWNNGAIEHITGNRDTLAYPSGDDHPSETGSRKATQEFIPLLNVWYHRWASGSSAILPLPQTAESQPVITNTQSVAAPAVTGMLFDFEGSPPTLDAFRDEATASQMNCAVTTGTAHAGSAALRIDADIASGSWGTCQITFDGQPGLGSGEGIAFYIHAERAGLPYDVDLYAGDTAEPETYMVTLETPPDSVDGWALVGIPWGEFTRVAWEEDAGTAFSTDLEVSAMAFGFNGMDAGNNAGTIWVDDISLAGAGSSGETGSQSQPEEAGSQGGLSLPCTGGVVFPLGVLGVMTALGVKKRPRDS